MGKRQTRRCIAVLMSVAMLFNVIWADKAVAGALEKHSEVLHNIEKPGICHIARGGGTAKMYKELNVPRCCL